MSRVSGPSSTTAVRGTAHSSTALASADAAELADGDLLRVGRSTLVFRAPTGRDSLATATAGDAVAVTISDAQRRVLVALCRPYADFELRGPGQ